MTAPSKHAMTSSEYLAFERSSNQKHEYLAGTIYAMVGGSARHNRIAGSTYAALYAQLRQRQCSIYPSDMRVKVVQTGLYTYPDITIVCGHELYEDNREDTLLNPAVIIEVLSPSTEKYDRGKKFQHYRSILSLREYIIIAQDTYHIERFARQSDNTWVLSEANSQAEYIDIPSIQCTLQLKEVYEKVTFSEEEEEEDRT
nr:Uma2 family endonuclease [Oscillochloris trichoides]